MMKWVTKCSEINNKIYEHFIFKPLNMKREKVNFLEYIWWSELGKQNIQTKKVYWLDNFKQVEFINDVFSWTIFLVLVALIA